MPYINPEADLNTNLINYQEGYPGYLGIYIKYLIKTRIYDNTQRLLRAEPLFLNIKLTF